MRKLGRISQQGSTVWLHMFGESQLCIEHCVSDEEFAAADTAIVCKAGICDAMKPQCHYESCSTADSRNMRPGTNTGCCVGKNSMAPTLLVVWARIAWPASARGL